MSIFSASKHCAKPQLGLSPFSSSHNSPDELGSHAHFTDLRLPRITLEQDWNSDCPLHSPCPNCLTKQQLIQSLVIFGSPSTWLRTGDKQVLSTQGRNPSAHHFQGSFSPLGIILRKIHSRKASIYSPCSILLLSVFSVSSLPIFYGVLFAT